MKVYIKYDSTIAGKSALIHFTRFVPFTEGSEVSYQVNPIKMHEMEVSIDGVVFATLPGEPNKDDAEKFVAYFLSLVCGALDSDRESFVIYEGQKLVEKLF